MKKHLTNLMLLAIVLVLASCKKDPNETLPDNPTLAVSKNDVRFSTPNDSTISISVESNVDWVAIKDGDDGAQWLTVTPEDGVAGVDAVTVNITVLQNDTGNERAAAIYFRHIKGNKTETVTVIQSPELDALGFDSLALVELYESTDGWNWKTPWDTESPVSTWKGVTVSPRGTSLRVVELNLEDQEIDAPLPECIKNLTELSTFISNKNVMGTTLPLFFTEMPKLKRLILGGSGFNGPIPEQYYEMTQLETLQLENNKLTGGISPKISQLTKLTNLSFGDCGLTGVIPTSVGTMAALTDINLFGNNFEGELPAEIGNIPTIKYIRLDNNPRLTGGIPESWGQIDSLKVLNISDNPMMKGALPASLGNCKILWEVLVSFSGTTGTIPDEWINAKGLETFQAYNTQMSGELPAWEKHPSLTNLIIRNNKALPGEAPYNYENHFTGQIPGFVGHLEIFNARNCDFEGTLNESIINTITLQDIDIANSTKLTGEVPSDFWLRTSVVNLDLSGTQLTGKLPTKEEYATLKEPLSIQSFNVENCKFYGPIPAELFDRDLAPKLNVARLAGNNFIGTPPSAIGGAVNLMFLSLANNRLSGEFPAQIKTNPGWSNVNMWNPLVNICPQQAGEGYGFTGTSCTSDAPAAANVRR